MGTEASANREDFDGDISEVDTIWLGNSTEVSGEEFAEALTAVQQMQDQMRNVRDELKRMDIALDRTDAVNLLWGRTNLNKGQIEGAFDVMDAIVEEDPTDIAPRLMADKTSDLTISEAATVWDDLARLAEKYGSLNDDTDNEDQT